MFSGSPARADTWSRHNLAAYGVVEMTAATGAWTLGAAARVEDFEDFGTTGTARSRAGWASPPLNEYLARVRHPRVRYWRDKRGHEIYFVLGGRGGPPVAIECKWLAAGFRRAKREGLSRPLSRRRQLRGD